MQSGPSTTELRGPTGSIPENRKGTALAQRLLSELRQTRWAKRFRQCYFEALAVSDVLLPPRMACGCPTA